MNAIVNLTQLSMDSIQIADLVEKRHDNVKRTIETLVKSGVISQPQFEDGIKSANGVVTKVYVFSGEQGKRDSIIVVAQLCPEFTARLVDRWQELENSNGVPKTFADALQLAADQAKQLELAQSQIQVLEPKAQALDTIASTDGTYNIRECAKTIGIGERKLIALLLDKKWCYRDGGKLQPYADKVTSGVFINRPSNVIVNKYTGEEKVHLHMRVTAFGLTRITGLVEKMKEAC